VRSLISADMTTGMAIFAPLMLNGLLLSIYIPFIPYMLFLFGVISWLIAVVCLMFAAPIICFLMLWGAASNENPLLSMEAEQFVKQLIAAFLRPALMVAGLVVGVVLCNISVNLLNLGFDSIFSNSVNVQQQNFLAGPTFNLDGLEKLGGVIVYTFIMISIVNMSFSAIHVLYTEVTRLLQIQGGSVNGSEAERLMTEVKTGSEGIGQAAGTGAKDSAGAMEKFQPHSGRRKEESDDKTVAENARNARWRKGGGGPGGQKVTAGKTTT
jgi:defect-in-organelle-trafficking protein DotA